MNSKQFLGLIISFSPFAYFKVKERKRQSQGDGIDWNRESGKTARGIRVEIRRTGEDDEKEKENGKRRTRRRV